MSLPRTRFLAVSLLTGCYAAASFPARSLVDLRSGSARGARITFDAHLPDGRPLGTPVVRATVADQPTLLIIDTGAAVSVLDRQLVESLDLKTRPLSERVEASGGTSVSVLLVEQARVSIEGMGEITGVPMIAADLPGVFRNAGIEGILSPQALAQGDEALVLDLAEGAMFLQPFEQAVRAVSAHGHAIAPAGNGTCEDATSAVPNLLFTVRGAVESEPIELMLDTGASHTVILASSAAGQRLAQRQTTSSQAVGAAGAYSTKHLANVHVTAGELATSTEIRLNPGEREHGCTFDGWLGIDVLRSCVLIMHRDRIVGRCGI